MSDPSLTVETSPSPPKPSRKRQPKRTTISDVWKAYEDVHIPVEFSGDLPPDMEWVYNHPALRGKPIGKYPSPPSMGALTMLEEAMEDRATFIKTVISNFSKTHGKLAGTKEFEGEKAATKNVEELRTIAARLMNPEKEPESR